MTFRAYAVSRYPQWDSWPIALRREYGPQLRRDYNDAMSGAIGRARVRYRQMAGMRVRNASGNFDLAIEALKQEGVLENE